MRVRTPRPWAERAHIVSFDVGGAKKASAAVEALRKRGILTSEKDGHLRAAVHFYNTPEDVDRFLEAVREA